MKKRFNSCMRRGVVMEMNAEGKRAKQRTRWSGVWYAIRYIWYGCTKKFGNRIVGWPTPCIVESVKRRRKRICFFFNVKKKNVFSYEFDVDPLWAVNFYYSSNIYYVVFRSVRLFYMLVHGLHTSFLSTESRQCSRDKSNGINKYDIATNGFSVLSIKTLKRLVRLDLKYITRSWNALNIIFIFHILLIIAR